MIFISEYDIITEPARSLIIYLTIGMVIGAFLISFYALISSRKSNRKLSSNYLIGIAVFFLFFGVGRLIYMIHDYFAPDSLEIILWKIATVVIFCGLTVFIYTLETFIYKKTKHIFSIIGVFILFMVIILELDFARFFIYAGNLILLIVPALIYIIMIRNSTGDVRKWSIVILIGMVIFAVGQGTALFEIVGLMDIISSSIFAPPVTLAGLVVLGYGLISMSR